MSNAKKQAARRSGARRRGARRPPGDRPGYPGIIRIIGGSWRGRRLRVPDAKGLRPTPDRVRETLFNWLAPWVPGARCIDLFAGTGALCLEALSRGAASVVMVEQGAQAATVLRANVSKLAAKNAEVVQADALAYLTGRAQAFDIVFVDPPFRSGLIEPVSELLESRGWLHRGTMIYVEAPARLDALPLPDTWERVRSGIAGQVGYHLFRKRR